MSRSVRRYDEKVEALALFNLGFKPRAVATRLGLIKSMVRQWYSLYSRYGEEALLVPPRKNNHYPYELKLGAVTDFCEQGLTSEEVLVKHHICSITQLKVWASAHRTQGADGLKDRPRGRVPRDLSTDETIEERCLRLELENAYLKNSLL